MTVHASYYTDPACPISWGAEPAVRRIAVEFGDSVSWTHIMAGIRQFGAPLQSVSAWLDVADRSGMPVDPRLWLDGPTTSYPACMAVKAAEEQGGRAGTDYLRALREGFAARRARQDHLDAFVEVARGIDGLDSDRFRIDAASHAILESFGEDLERFRSDETLRLPTIDLRGEDGEVQRVQGALSYEDLRAAVVAAGAEPTGAWPLSVEDALRRFGTLATVEVADLCDLPGPRAPVELWRLAQEWRVRREPVLTGELWTAA